MYGLPTNLPDLKYPFPICLLTKATKIPRDTIIDVSKFAPGFILHMDFAFFNAESILDVSRLLWLYIMLIHYPLDFHPEANARFLTS